MNLLPYLRFPVSLRLRSVRAPCGCWHTTRNSPVNAHELSGSDGAGRRGDRGLSAARGKKASGEWKAGSVDGEGRAFLCV